MFSHSIDHQTSHQQKSAFEGEIERKQSSLLVFVLRTELLRFTLENYDNFDSNDIHSTDGDTSDVELNDADNDKYLVSSGYQCPDDGDDVDNINNDDLVEVDTVIGDRLLSINSITSDEIRAIEFGTVDEAYEFYYRYGKCKGFAIRKNDVRSRRPKGYKKAIIRKFV
ncbi:hypothetical protein KIW84_072433 [Lathyrus oleraceus]|uniref:Uncharacterized protein n=1 Tax=Pisum sativum TaxID=3888 RepID=A0A9D4ZV46_PEA|nr:hypothetical protein KIW84_072433 [Pisum sativum]